MTEMTDLQALNLKSSGNSPQKLQRHGIENIHPSNRGGKKKNVAAIMPVDKSMDVQQMNR